MSRRRTHTGSQQVNNDPRMTAEATRESFPEHQPFQEYQQQTNAPVTPQGDYFNNRHISNGYLQEPQPSTSGTLGSRHPSELLPPGLAPLTVDINELLSYHMPYPFKNSYCKRTVSVANIPPCDNYCSYLGKVFCSEFESSWQMDKYIIPTKYKAHLHQARSSWNVPIDNEENHHDPGEPMKDTAFKIPLPLNTPRSDTDSSCAAGENLKRNKKQRNKQSKIRASTSTRAPHSSPSISGEDSCDRGVYEVYDDFTMNSKPVPDVSDKIKKEEIFEVGEAFTLDCEPGVITVSEESCIEKTETFLEEEYGLMNI